MGASHDVGVAHEEAQLVTVVAVHASSRRAGRKVPAGLVAVYLQQLAHAEVDEGQAQRSTRIISRNRSVTLARRRSLSVRRPACSGSGGGRRRRTLSSGWASRQARWRQASEHHRRGRPGRGVESMRAPQPRQRMNKYALAADLGPAPPVCPTHEPFTCAEPVGLSGAPAASRGVAGRLGPRSAGRACCCRSCSSCAKATSTRCSWPSCSPLTPWRDDERAGGESLLGQQEPGLLDVARVHVAAHEPTVLGGAGEGGGARAHEGVADQPAGFGEGADEPAGAVD